MTNKLYLIICSNRTTKLPLKTVRIIEQLKINTVFVKQNLRKYYINHPYITEIISSTKGVSVSRNIGINYAIDHNASILGFTDDDCILTKNWFKSIIKSFKNKHINVIFGRTLPYQPKKHPNQVCTSVFDKKNNSDPVTSITTTWDNVGLSNNFAIRSKIIKTVGHFSEKIGPGTKIARGEDDDFNIRIIEHGFPIYYNHQMLIYHNKWLNISEVNQIYQWSTFGFAFVYTYHAIHTNRKYLFFLTKDLLKEMLVYLSYLRFLNNPFAFIKLIHNHNLILYNFIKGVVLAPFKTI